MTTCLLSFFLPLYHIIYVLYSMLWGCYLQQIEENHGYNLCSLSKRKRPQTWHKSLKNVSVGLCILAHISCAFSYILLMLKFLWFPYPVQQPRMGWDLELNKLECSFLRAWQTWESEMTHLMFLKTESVPANKGEAALYNDSTPEVSLSLLLSPISGWKRIEEWM